MSSFKNTLSEKACNLNSPLIFLLFILLKHLENIFESLLFYNLRTLSAAETIITSQQNGP